MFLASLSGTVRADAANDLTAGEVEQRLSHELTRIGLIVLSDEPGHVSFATPTVTDGKTWWWIGWGMFAMVNGGSFAFRDIAHDIIAYRLLLGRMLFWSIFGPTLFLAILIAPSITQHKPFLLLIAPGFWLTAYFGNRFVLRYRIRRWVRRTVARPIEANLA